MPATPQHRSTDSSGFQRAVFFLVHQHGRFNCIELTNELVHAVHLLLAQVFTIGLGCCCRLLHQTVNRVTINGVGSQGAGIQPGQPGQARAGGVAEGPEQGPDRAVPDSLPTVALKWLPPPPASEYFRFWGNPAQSKEAFTCMPGEAFRYSDFCPVFC